MDLLELSGLDFVHIEKPVELLVNSEPGLFSQRLFENDNIIIRLKKETAPAENDSER